MTTTVRVASVLAVTGASLLVASGCNLDFTDAVNGGGGNLVVGRTFGIFRAIQVDPQSEDSSGPQFVVAGDLNNDGLLDLVSAWNQSQPVQIHLQGRNDLNQMSFETVTLAGSVPVVSVAGLGVADFDEDGRLDIAVLVKQSLLADPVCPNNSNPADAELSGVILLYMGPEDTDLANRALAWEEIPVTVSRLAGAGSPDGLPEDGGFTNMTSGDMDGDGDMDLVVAWNSACDGEPQVIIFRNEGPGRVRDGTWVLTAIPDQFATTRGERIKSASLGDIDGDGDLDVVATYPDATALNVRWYRNPARDVLDDYHISDGTWQTGTIGHVRPRAGLAEAGGADIASVSDIDADGRLDVIVRSSGGGLIQWFKGPVGPTTAPLRQLPWQVYTIAEYTDRAPASFSLGDVDGDGQAELIATADGGLSWFDPPTGTNGVYQQWIENLIVDERPEQSDTPTTTDPNIEPGSEELVEATLMNSVLVADLDNDNKNDLIVPFDRSGLSGLTSDLIVWFRNIR